MLYKHGRCSYNSIRRVIKSVVTCPNVQHSGGSRGGGGGGGHSGHVPPPQWRSQGNIDGRARNGGKRGGGGGGGKWPFESAWYNLNLSMHGYNALCKRTCYCYSCHLFGPNLVPN